MGTWGPGNFENDAAADHLHELCGPLLEAIAEAMADPSSLEPDELNGDLVPANLEILACLSEHLGRLTRGPIPDVLYPCVLPPAKVVAQWKRKYLKVWDAYINELDPDPEFRKDRRAVLAETFDRVERLARALQAGPDGPDRADAAPPTLAPRTPKPRRRAARRPS